jgi:hypothetical protein
MYNEICVRRLRYVLVKDISRLEWLFLTCDNYWIIRRLVGDGDHPFAIDQYWGFHQALSRIPWGYSISYQVRLCRVQYRMP